MINLILNVIWLCLGGVAMGLGWILAGVIMAISIIGIPWARSCFRIAGFTFWPFGREAVNRSDMGQPGIGTGPLGTLGNIIWFILAGLWLAIGHVVSAGANFITIIGIPLGWQHLKLAAVSLAPVGKTIVDKK